MTYRPNNQCGSKSSYHLLCTSNSDVFFMVDNFFLEDGISYFFFCDPKETIVLNIFISHNFNPDVITINEESPT